MICHLKYIFMWISLILQPTGNVFIWVFVITFSVFTFFFPIGTPCRSIHFIMYFSQVIFVLTLADGDAF